MVCNCRARKGRTTWNYNEINPHMNQGLETELINPLHPSKKDMLSLESQGEFFITLHTCWGCPPCCNGCLLNCACDSWGVPVVGSCEGGCCFPGKRLSGCRVRKSVKIILKLCKVHSWYALGSWLTRCYATTVKPVLSSTTLTVTLYWAVCCQSPKIVTPWLL